MKVSFRDFEMVAFFPPRRLIPKQFFTVAYFSLLNWSGSVDYKDYWGKIQNA
jgi:hypothetical protein